MVEGAQPLAQLDVKTTIAQCSIDNPVGATMVALVDPLFIFTTVLQQHGGMHNQPMPAMQVTWIAATMIR